MQQLDRLALFSGEELKDEAAHLDGGSFEQASVRRQTAKRKPGIEEEGHDVGRRIATAEGEIEGPVIGFMPMEKGAFEIRAERPEQSGGQEAFERAGGLGAISFRDGEYDQKVRIAIVHRLFDRDRVHDAAIHIEAIADAYRMGIEDGQSGAGFERGQQIELSVMAVEEDFAPGLDLGRDDIERRPVLAQAIEIEPFSARDDLPEEEVHVNDFPEARGVDEAAIGDVLVVDRSAERGLSGQEVRAVDGSGRGPVDGVEGVDEAELLQGDDGPSAGDAAHGAALEDAGRLARDGSPALRLALALPLKDMPQGGLRSQASDAMKILVSPGIRALRLEAKTSFRPSGENMGKPSKVGLKVIRSSPVPSSLMRKRSKLRREGS